MPQSLYAQCLIELGFPGDLEVQTPEDYDRVMAVWKKLLVEARQNGDEDRAKTLSFCKTVIQKRHRKHKDKICPRCGEIKHKESEHCRVCHQSIPHHGQKLHTHSVMPDKLHELDPTPIPIPEHFWRVGELTRAMEKLGQGYVGDSFVTNKATSTCVAAARIAGGKISCRIVNPLEKDIKKRLHRVWRIDDCTLEQVNDIIQKRLRGEIVPKPPAWVPLPKEERDKIRGYRYRKKSAAK